MIVLEKELPSGAKIKATAKVDAESGRFSWEISIRGAGSQVAREIAGDLFLDDLNDQTKAIIDQDLHRGADMDPEAKLAQELAQLMGGWEVTRADGSAAPGGGEN
jgi:hypothetical protein